MKPIIFLSLAIAVISMGLTLIGWKTRKIKSKQLICISATFYAIFIVLSIFFYQSQEQAVALGKSDIEVTKEQQKPIGSLSIKTEITGIIRVGKLAYIEVSISNSGDSDLKNVIMDLSKSEINTFFELQKIVIDNQEVKAVELVSIGELRKKLEKKIVLELLPQEAGVFVGEVFWFEGEKDLVNEKGEPLISTLEVTINEEALINTDDTKAVTENSAEKVSAEVENKPKENKDSSDKVTTENTQDTGGAAKPNTPVDDNSIEDATETGDTSVIEDTY